MTLVTWNPEQELGLLQRRMNWIFEDLFGGTLRTGGARQMAAFEPHVDIREDAQAYYIHAELPGVRKEDVGITMRDNTLTIRGEKKQESRKDEANDHRLERNFGAFERSFTLPVPVQSGKVDASFTDGVLTVVLPKTEEAKPKEIAVKVR